MPHLSAEQASAKLWRRWLVFSALTGGAAGIVWWLLAPGGAFFGDRSQIGSWFPRDATLAILLVLAGALGAVLAIRELRPAAHAEHSARPARTQTAGPPTVRVIALAVSGLAGSVIAWRMGVFAGDLFSTPPANMPNPSMVFSLRSGPVLLVWPLVSVVVMFFWNFFSYTFRPGPESQVHTTAGVNG